VDNKQTIRSKEHKNASSIDRLHTDRVVAVSARRLVIVRLGQIVDKLSQSFDSVHSWFEQPACKRITTMFAENRVCSGILLAHGDDVVGKRTMRDATLLCVHLRATQTLHVLLGIGGRHIFALQTR
jgi:hypothetical protein